MMSYPAIAAISLMIALQFVCVLGLGRAMTESDRLIARLAETSASVAEVQSARRQERAEFNASVAALWPRVGAPGARVGPNPGGAICDTTDAPQGYRIDFEISPSDGRTLPDSRPPSPYRSATVSVLHDTKVYGMYLLQRSAWVRAEPACTRIAGRALDSRPVFRCVAMCEPGSHPSRFGPSVLAPTFAAVHVTFRFPIATRVTSVVVTTADGREWTPRSIQQMAPTFVDAGVTTNCRARTSDAGSVTQPFAP